MTAGRSRADLATASRLLEGQWRTLRAWLGAAAADDGGPTSVVQAPSALPGLTVLDLIARVDGALGALAAAEQAPPGVAPLTLAEFFSAVRSDAERDARRTRELAVEIAPAPLAALDAVATAAFARLRALGPEDRAVETPRAAMMLSDLTVSRLVELVVHSDDLSRSIPRPGEHPIDPEALQLAADALLGIVVARGGWSLELVNPLLWVRLAAGRLPRELDRLAEALQARFTSDSVPDLGRMLPLL